MSSLVYLCGPITGLTYEEAAKGWRGDVFKELTELGIDVVSPMRAKHYLSAETSLDAAGYPSNVLSSARGIVERDEFDVHRSDLIFCNLLGARTVSIGSVMELAWAKRERIPTVVVMEPEGNLHDHCFVVECTSFRCATLDEAVRVTKAVLSKTL